MLSDEIVTRFRRVLPGLKQAGASADQIYERLRIIAQEHLDIAFQQGVELGMKLKDNELNLETCEK